MMRRSAGDVNLSLQAGPREPWRKPADPISCAITFLPVMRGTKARRHRRKWIAVDASQAGWLRLDRQLAQNETIDA
jgi:hypothetical protein